jgi:hypothetical protein
MWLLSRKAILAGKLNPCANSSTFRFGSLILGVPTAPSAPDVVAASALFAGFDIGVKNNVKKDDTKAIPSKIEITKFPISNKTIITAQNNIIYILTVISGSVNMVCLLKELLTMGL